MYILYRLFKIFLSIFFFLHCEKKINSHHCRSLSLLLKIYTAALRERMAYHINICVEISHQY